MESQNPPPYTPTPETRSQLSAWWEKASTLLLCVGLLTGGTMIEVKQRDFDDGQNDRMERLEGRLDSMESRQHRSKDRDASYAVHRVQLKLDLLQKAVEKYGESSPQLVEATRSLVDSLDTLAESVCTPELEEEVEEVGLQLQAGLSLQAAKGETVSPTLVRLHRLLKIIKDLCARTSN